MPLYIVQFSYTPAAWTTLAKNSEDRGVVLGRLLKKLDSRLTPIYCCFGESDGCAIFEAPDEAAVLATIITAYLTLPSQNACHEKEAALS